MFLSFYSKFYSVHDSKSRRILPQVKITLRFSGIHFINVCRADCIPCAWATLAECASRRRAAASSGPCILGVGPSVGLAVTGWGPAHSPLASDSAALGTQRARRYTTLERLSQCLSQECAPPQTVSAQIASPPSRRPGGAVAGGGSGVAAPGHG